METVCKFPYITHVWTINDENTMRKLIDLGVDGIITDRPKLLKEVLSKN